MWANLNSEKLKVSSACRKYRLSRITHITFDSWILSVLQSVDQKSLISYDLAIKKSFSHETWYLTLQLCWNAFSGAIEWYIF